MGLLACSRLLALPLRLRNLGAVDIDDSQQLVFAPELGNVAFASAADCWAFTVPQFARFFAQKLGESWDARGDEVTR